MTSSPTPSTVADGEALIDWESECFLLVSFPCTEPISSPSTLLFGFMPPSPVLVSCHSACATDIKAFSYYSSLNSFSSNGLLLPCSSILVLSHSDLCLSPLPSWLHLDCLQRWTFDVARSCQLFISGWVTTTIGSVSVSCPPGSTDQVFTRAPSSLDSTVGFRPGVPAGARPVFVSTMVENTIISGSWPVFLHPAHLLIPLQLSVGLCF